MSDTIKIKSLPICFGLLFCKLALFLRDRPLLLRKVALLLCDFFGLFGAGAGGGLLILGVFGLNACYSFSFERLF
jgi:hypothetical protein